MSLRSRGLFVAGVCSLLLISLAIVDTTAATTTTEPDSGAPPATEASGPSEAVEESTGTPTSETSTTSDVLAEPTIDGTFAVGRDGHPLDLRCFGRGEPVIVLEAGTDSSGFEVFPPSFVRPLAEQHMTCVYERVGTGGSGPPPEPRRTIDDVVNDLDELLHVAAVPEPYLLVGSSGGGNIVVQFAASHADHVAGLVLLDAGAPIADLASEFPGEQAWGGPEHIDWVAAEYAQSRLEMPIGDFPALVITAEGGASDDEDQSYWLDLSPNARQIVMPGGHDLYQETPDAVAEQVLSTLTSG
jgi:pimeloyl-ACP methyl ester carboxylesterase